MSLISTRVDKELCHEMVNVLSNHCNHQVRRNKLFNLIVLPNIEPTAIMSESNRQQESLEPVESSLLRFSIVNILKPNFGQNAVLGTRNLTTESLTSVKVIPLSIPNSSSFPQDHSSSSQSPLKSPSSALTSSFELVTTTQKDQSHSLSSYYGLDALISKQTSSLSRSTSLESLASSQSSVVGSSINYSPLSTPSLSTCSSSSSLSLPTVLGSGFETHNIENSPNNSSPLQTSKNRQSIWPAWIYCTRYSDRPSSGPRTRRVKRNNDCKSTAIPEEKRPRTAFSAEQLSRLRHEFTENRYLTEPRRQKLSKELGLHEQQIKIWFQNKRAKIKKASGQKNPLALQLMAQGLYNHTTVPVDVDENRISADLD